MKLSKPGALEDGSFFYYQSDILIRGDFAQEVIIPRNDFCGKNIFNTFYRGRVGRRVSFFEVVLDSSDDDRFISSPLISTQFETLNVVSSTSYGSRSMKKFGV